MHRAAPLRLSVRSRCSQNKALLIVSEVTGAEGSSGSVSFHSCSSVIKLHKSQALNPSLWFLPSHHNRDYYQTPASARGSFNKSPQLGQFKGKADKRDSDNCSRLAREEEEEGTQAERVMADFNRASRAEKCSTGAMWTSTHL